MSININFLKINNKFDSKIINKTIIFKFFKYSLFISILSIILFIIPIYIAIIIMAPTIFEACSGFIFFFIFILFILFSISS